MFGRFGVRVPRLLPELKWAKFTNRPTHDNGMSGRFELIVEAGLIIEAFGEPRVSVEIAKAEPALEDTLVARLFLYIRAIKPTMTSSAK
jgi:hypothetical protein